MKPKIVTTHTLHLIDPTVDCFIIKNTLTKKMCCELVAYLKCFAYLNRDHSRVKGENWHYMLNVKDITFDYFTFNELEKLDFPLLTDAYQNLFNLYNLLGEKTFYNDFKKEIKISDFATDFRTICPLVFWYFNGLSKFDFHKHDIRNQKFQLLTNLTQPNYDYIGGETWVYMGEGRPNLNDPFLAEQCVVFGEEFEIGDTFSFPYDKWHRVNKCFDAAYKNGNRVSLLMPLGARNWSESKEEIL